MISTEPGAEEEGPTAGRENRGKWNKPWLWVLALTAVVAVGFCTALVNRSIGFDDTITRIWAVSSCIVVTFAIGNMRRSRPTAGDNESGDGSISSSDSGDGGGSDSSDSWATDSGDSGGGSSDSGGGSDSSGSSC